MVKATNTSPKGVAIKILLKTLIALWALSDGALSLVVWGDEVEIPLLEWLLAILHNGDAWGMGTVFAALGIGALFYYVREEGANPPVSIISSLFAVCTVVGISYATYGDWNCLFGSLVQFLMAVLVALGYYFLYRGSILAVSRFLSGKPGLWRVSAEGKAEKLLFERSTFLLPLAVIVLCALPWLIFYWPGTLQWDAHRQLYMYFGVEELTGHHPVIITKLMGSCMVLGRVLFGSDEMGIFLYTGPQIVAQMLIFAYTMRVLTKLRVPILFRKLALAFYAGFPLLWIWGYTFVKDTGYYLCMLLFVAVTAEIAHCEHEKTKWWQALLWAVGLMGMILFRNDGKYVVVITLIAMIVLCRKYWKQLVAALVAAVLLVFFIEDIYMPMENNPPGPIKEALCVPLLQTARYVKEHPEDITAWEEEVLLSVFEGGYEAIAERYIGYNGDGIKEIFVSYPAEGQLADYFKVWWQQFLRHPDTYVQAFLHHIYGYFYPDQPNIAGDIGYFAIGNAQHWVDGYFNIAFGVEDRGVRDLLKEYTLLLNRLPVVGMLYSPGAIVYMLLGCVAYVLWKKKWSDSALFVPGLCVVLISMASPIGAFIRYVLPVLVMLPLYIGICFRQKEEVE